MRPHFTGPRTMDWESLYKHLWIGLAVMAVDGLTSVFIDMMSVF